LTKAWGCRTGPSGYIGWQAGTPYAVVNFIPRVRDYEFGYFTFSEGRPRTLLVKLHTQLNNAFVLTIVIKLKRIIYFETSF
jgi:hypothetical protein